MRLRNILLLSLGLNLLLGTIAITQTTAPPVPTTRSPKVQFVHKTVVETRTNTAPVQAVALATNTFQWSDLESPDYAVYVANLRGIGCPERTLQHIILQDLEKLYREKDRGESKEPTLWMTAAQREAVRRENQLREASLVDEKFQIIRKLLGRAIDWEARKMWIEQREPAWFLAFLSDDQAEQVLSIGHRMGSQMESRLRDPSVSPEESIEKATALYRETMKEFAAVASPEQIEEGLLRMSLGIQIAMQRGIGKMVLSGDELRRLAAIQRKEEEPFTKVLRMIENQGRTPSTIYSTNYINDARQLLGDQRFAELMFQQDRELQVFGKLLGPSAPTSTLLKAFEVQQAALEEAENVRADSNLSRAEKRAELRSIQEMSKAALTELGDEKAVETYLKDQASWWKALRNP